MTPWLIDSKFKDFFKEIYRSKWENLVANAIYNTVHNLHSRSRTRAVPRCASMLFEIDSPLRFHRVWPTLPLGQSWLPQCQMSHPGEDGGLSLASVTITTVKQIKINFGCVFDIPNIPIKFRDWHPVAAPDRQSTPHFIFHFPYPNNLWYSYHRIYMTMTRVRSYILFRFRTQVLMKIYAQSCWQSINARRTLNNYYLQRCIYVWLPTYITLMIMYVFIGKDILSLARSKLLSQIHANLNC